jgi:hypothetical protein
MWQCVGERFLCYSAIARHPLPLPVPVPNLIEEPAVHLIPNQNVVSMSWFHACADGLWHGN